VHELVTVYGLKKKDVQKLLDELEKFEKVVGVAKITPLKPVGPCVLFACTGCSCAASDACCACIIPCCTGVSTEKKEDKKDDGKSGAFADVSAVLRLRVTQARVAFGGCCCSLHCLQALRPRAYCPARSARAPRLSLRWARRPRRPPRRPRRSTRRAESPG
jgi:hypothetical protein